MASDNKHAADELPLPRLAALFLINFDVKVGYSIVWKRSLSHVPVDGVVEYRSLPSGLHNVKQDLVYFSQDNFAGISAFAKGDTLGENRNAKFVSVGALLPSSDGRLGRAWMHASGLAHLARELLVQPLDLGILQEYWDENKVDGADDESKAAQLSPFTLAQRRVRKTSTEALSAADKQILPANHPIWSIMDYINTFGPLIYPLHRAALLRKRILMITHAPVRQACEFVYDLSIASSTPLSLASSLYLPSESLIRLRPLFSVGIHDIPLLESMETSEQEITPSWLACSTDEILATKKHLYDIVVELPASSVKMKRPIIRSTLDNKPLKATQRDFRRWRILNQIIGTALAARTQGKNTLMVEGDESEFQPLLGLVDPAAAYSKYGTSDNDDESQNLERTTWSELAYSSFLWWASAGEQDDFLVEENNHDESAMGDLLDLVEQLVEEDRLHQQQESSTDPSRNLRLDARLEVALISYFQGLTKTLLDVGTEILNDENDDDMNDAESKIIFGRDELRRLGLDAWSSNDAVFVKAFFKLWFERDVKIDKSSIECCGIKVC